MMNLVLALPVSFFVLECQGISLREVSRYLFKGSGSNRRLLEQLDSSDLICCIDGSSYVHVKRSILNVTCISLYACNYILVACIPNSVLHIFYTCFHHSH